MTFEEKTVDEQLQAVLEAMAQIRLRKAMPEEYELHQAVAQALAQAGLPARHEARLGSRCRVDFLVGQVAVEIKKGKIPRGRLAAQCARYAAMDSVGALVLAAPRELSLPGRLCGKEIRTFSFYRLWGPALP